MAHLTPPRSGLKILTLDGGGLQAIDTLLILDRLLLNIQKQNGAATKPRPCDVFDVITGIGAGGWLALLLGRFRLETRTCLSEWQDLLRRIVPRTRGEGMRRRVFKHSYWDEEHLVQHVKSLTRLYGTGEKLLDRTTSIARCKHVFVAARKSHDGHEEPEYTLFRSYRVPEGDLFRSGPSDPETFTIASAFGVTGATKYFSQPWKEHTAAHGKISFFDNAFPHPHNITLPTLKEVWALYGQEVPISIIVNIGPGLPTDHDLSAMSRRFSFGLKESLSYISSPLRSMHMPGKQAKPKPSQGRPEGKNVQEPTTGQTISKIAYGRRNQRLQDEEKQHEARVKEELRRNYVTAPPYYRLSIEFAPPGSVRNDSYESDALLEATDDYSGSQRFILAMDEIKEKVDMSDIGPVQLIEPARA